MSDIASAERVSAATVKADFGLFEVCLPEAWVNLARPVPRDRDAEFRARGAVEDLLAETELVRAAFVTDVMDTDLEASPADPPAGRLPTHLGVQGGPVVRGRGARPAPEASGDHPGRAPRRRPMRGSSPRGRVLWGDTFPPGS